MPKDPHTSRQRPVSCRFCRVRKLRCSRTAPCSNCVSRGIRCELEIINDLSSCSPHSSESEIIQRLNRLERLLTIRKEESEGTEKQPPDVGLSQRHHSRVQSTSIPAFSPQIQGLVDDAAKLENIYMGQGHPVSQDASNVGYR
jgi:Zn(2)-Cys(6) binuclear cluster domain-containing protein